MKSKSSRLWIGVFLVAFLLRLGYALWQPEEFWDKDEGVYLDMARNFVAGEGMIYTPYRKAAFPPLYPFFLAGLLGAGLPVFPAARTEPFAANASRLIRWMSQAVSGQSEVIRTRDWRGAGSRRVLHRAA